MDIMSSDGKIIIDVGTYKNWNALYSTAWTLLKKDRKQYKATFSFLKSGECEADKIGTVLNEISAIKNELKKIDASKAVYNYKKVSEKGPWENNEDNKLKSCADLFVTSEGDNLLNELLALLVYCRDNKLSIALP